MGTSTDSAAHRAPARDTVFRPASPSGARTLTAGQVESFNQDGFLRPLPALSGDEVERVRAYVDDLVDTVVSAPDRRNSYSIAQYHLVCQGLYDLVQHPRLLDYAQDILGPDVVCWGTQLFCKLPGDLMEVPLHQDAAYWLLTPTRTVTAWLAIDDVDAENAAMEFVAGSHLGGVLDHEDLELDGSRVLRRQVRHLERYGDRVTNSLRAGEVSLHSDLMLHGSGPNRSERRRAGLTVRYVAASVHALRGAEYFYKGSVHCRGEVPDRWANHPRPDGENPERMAQFSGEFDGNPGGNPYTR